jgi:ABC-type antimicrobial peptide transport system permease subunit
VNFLVVGTLIAKGTGTGRDPDDQVLIPLSTARTRLFGTDAVRTISVQISSEQAMERAQGEIDDLLRARHGLAAGATSDFSIGSQKDLLDTAGQVADTFTALLAAVAAISLLVGGIGIMNIMLVSVTERTREIGIRKAIGAQKLDIMLQFLIEAVSISLMGGLIGLGLGYFVVNIVAPTINVTMIMSSGVALLALVFSVLVGVIFGSYPANKASSLLPIEALRYE